VVNAVLDRLDVTVEHRGVGLQAGLVDLAGKLEPAVGVAFVVADPGARRLGKDLGTAAGTRIHSRGVQFIDHVLVRHLVEPCKKIELDHRQCLDMKLWKLTFQRREKIGVVLKGKLAVQAADDV
jgi:hypothetical protein